MRRMGRRIALLLLLGLCVVSRATAQPANRQEMRAVCQAWLEHRTATQGSWAGSPDPAIAGEQPVTQGGAVLGCTFRIAPDGFILVPARKELCPVWFFSEAGSLDPGTDNVAARVIGGRLALTVEAAAGDADPSRPHPRALDGVASETNRSRWARMTQDKPAWMKESAGPVAGVGPLLSTVWHQGPPFNLFCPIGRNGIRCVAGCTPIAAAQIARYHAYPPGGGTGQADHQWPGDDCGVPPSAGALLHADFRSAYDWDRMPDSCLPTCGGAADSAVAELCFELGVASQADYGTSCGTGAVPEYAAQALQVHFGYGALARRVSRAQMEDAHQWFSLLRNEITAYRPVLYVFTYSSGAGNHALVCDGWRIEAGIEYVSLNLGGGGVTGWFVAGDNGLSFPLMDNAIINLAPPDRVVTVGPSGEGNYPTIQAAIDATPNRTVIELLDGVYRGPGNRDLDCRGKALTIRSRSDDPALCILDCEGSANDPHRAFEFHHQETASTTIQSLTIRNGYLASGGPTDPTRGGAVVCDGAAAPRFQNCVFTENRADQGGAIGCSDSAAPGIETCVFWRNTALEGGACYKTGPGEIQISGSTFSANRAVTGGALYAGPPCALLITESIVSHSRTGEGVHVAGGATARLSCCDLYANAGGDWIGGLADQLGQDGNISADPVFCDAETGDLRLNVSSPCAEPACGLQGARPAACGELVYYVGAALQYQYNTIAQALAVAREGGRIVLVDSLYMGEGNRDLTVSRRGLTIESAALDPAACVLDLQGSAAEPHRAFRLQHSPGVTIRGITVRHGWMRGEGAILAQSADSVRILNCAFRHCAAGGPAESPGGGAVTIAGDSSHGGRTTIRDCSFDACSSSTGGGAVTFWYRDFADTVFVDNCFFTSNTAQVGGGALSGHRARTKVNNSVFRANAAPHGSAVMVDTESRIWLASCTMVENTAVDNGGCVYIDEAKSEGHFRNCIIAANTGRPPIACSVTPGTTVTVLCCDLWPDEEDDWNGCTSGWRDGNISLDPQFCSGQSGDYSLHATSPCLPDQPGNQGCGPVGALAMGCGPWPPDTDETGLAFRRCAPNPFHQEMRIDYVVPARAAGRALDISIYDAGGRLVRTLFQGPGRPGEQTASWNALGNDGRRVGSGVFFCRLRAGAEEAGRRLIVVR